MMKGLKNSLLCALILGIATTASAQFPLRLNIDVSARQNKSQVGAGASGEARVNQVQVTVNISQRGGQLYTEPLQMELYVIGRQTHTGNYGIMDVVEKNFTFTKENQRSFEFKSQQYAFPETRGNIGVGAKYETYLVVVTDKDDNVIDTRSGRVIRDEGIAFIRELGPMTLFDRDGNVLGKVENPGQAFRTALPSAVNPGSSNE
jgi:hypothetical protein